MWRSEREIRGTQTAKPQDTFMRVAIARACLRDRCARLLRERREPGGTLTSRVWGAGETGVDERGDGGSTPTRVGSGNCRAWSIPTSRRHPHARGEKAIIVPNHMLGQATPHATCGRSTERGIRLDHRTATPPHMWGVVEQGHQNMLGGGSTLTRVRSGGGDLRFLAGLSRPSRRCVSGAGTAGRSLASRIITGIGRSGCGRSAGLRCGRHHPHARGERVPARVAGVAGGGSTLTRVRSGTSGATWFIGGSGPAWRCRL
ncbi:hypothetical protein GKJPGBOP_00067 [Streptomyces paromomycinus]|uniref:Uncharacterized protein n=1 Tax=Streptomyces paromomycinus TaxID=92743 RepID=A0A401VTJ9_STREY|nr:hypothetical protein GKJPGBOP_00067 [Streptomyces paromomycinus]